MCCICSFSIISFLVNIRLQGCICIFTVLDFFSQVILNYIQCSITDRSLSIYILFKFGLKSSICFFTFSYLSIDIPLESRICSSSVFDFLIYLLCDCCQLLSDSCSEIRVIPQCFSNLFQSVKYFGCRTNNLFDCSLYIGFSLIPSIIY